MLEALLKGTEYFYVLARDYPILATIVFLGVLFIGANFIFSQIAEFKKIFQSQWIHSRIVKIGVPIAVCAAAILSWEVVQFTKESTEPVPKIDEKLPATFIGVPLQLQWTYQRPSSRFEIESSKNSTFSEDPKKEGYRNGSFIQKEHVNDTRYWRVRAVSFDNQKMSGWSSPIQIAHYDSSLLRIKKTHKIRVYMSDSLNEAFFKFEAKDVNSTVRGYDVAIMDEIVKKLPARLGIDRLLNNPTTYVAWEDLLSAPSTGLADVIISTITSTTEREGKFSIKFSEPYYCTTHSVVYRLPKLSQPIPQMIANKRVGVQKETTSEKLLQQFVSENQTIRTVNEGQVAKLGVALRNNRIDYAITDTEFALAEQRKYPNSLEVRELISKEDFSKLTEPEDRVQKYAVAVRADEKDLIEAINQIIGEMRAKTLGALLEGAIKEFYTDRGDPRDAPVIDATKDPSECRTG
jgi:ABC-type amino acid transport substrate-binding protein